MEPKSIHANGQEINCENQELSENVIRSFLAFMAAESYSLKMDVLDTPTCEKLCTYLESMLKTSQENALCLIRGFFNFKSVICKSPFYTPKQ